MAHAPPEEASPPASAGHPAIISVPFGPPALGALAGVIRAVRAGDPLSAVTVVTSSLHVSISVRRHLARLPHGNGRGLAGVRWLLAGQLAEALAGPQLARERRPPLTGLLRRAAVRAALDRVPGRFAGVVDNAAFERRLEATFDELGDADEEQLRRLSAGSSYGAELVALYRSFVETCEPMADRRELLARACEAVHAGEGPLDDVGHVVLYLPERLGRGERALAGALVGQGRLTVLVGVAGDQTADRPVREMCNQLVADWDVAAVELGTAADPHSGSTVFVRAPDPDEEVRLAVRRTLEALEAGTAPEDIAIVTRVASPYVTLAHELLAEAGVPHHAPAGTSLAQSAAGRTLLGFLRVADRGFRRDELFRWVRGTPVRDVGGGPVPPIYDRLARRAGIVGGIDEWRARLDRLAGELASQTWAGTPPVDAGDATADTGDTPPTSHPRDRTIAGIDGLQTFVNHLALLVEPPTDRSWAAVTAWLATLIDRLVGGRASIVGGPQPWPPAELDAYDEVLGVLDGLGALDAVEPGADTARIVRALRQELDRPVQAAGAVGHGVFVGGLHEIVGARHELVFVLGMAEGRFPPRPMSSSLIPEADRRVLGDDADPVREAREREARDMAAVLRAAPARQLSFARVDVSSQREATPARAFLRELGTVLGRPVGFDQLDGVVDRAFIDVPSFVAGASRAGSALSRQERRVAGLLDRGEAYRDLDRGLGAVTARLGRAFTRWTGDVGALDELRFEGDRAGSPTSFEQWATCPFRYFLSHVLRVRPYDRYAGAERIGGRDRGSLVHETLERFVAERIADAQPMRWSEDERARLRAHLADVAARYESGGRTGRQLVWEAERDRLVRRLERVLEAEGARGQAGIPVAVELGFGIGESPPVVVVTGSGRQVSFRGMVDRIDRDPTTGRLVVIDYKTGTDEGYGAIARDITAAGRHLQLVVYGEAVRERFGGDEVGAYFWFVEVGSAGKRVGGVIGDAERARFGEVVDVIVDGIEQGRFPANPGDADFFGFEHCRFCDYNRVCPQRRDGLWEGVRLSPKLDAYRRLDLDSAVTVEADERDGAPVDLPAPAGDMAHEHVVPPVPDVISSTGDDDARARLRHELDRTLFVEAGAGTGKTTQLVDRIIQLVVTGALADIGRLSAITFTEAAAAELRHRVVECLERAGREHEPGSVERRRVDDALERIDDAAISTLHGFAARILADFPVEAGLPPGFEVTDEIAAELVERERWAAFLDDLFSDAAIEPVLRRALRLGLTVRHLDDVRVAFAANWDRVEAVTFPDHGLGPVHVEPVLAAVDRAVTCARRCGGRSKALERTLAELPAFRRRLAAEADDDGRLAVLLHEGPVFPKFGNVSKPELVELRECVDQVRETLDALIRSVRLDTLEPLLARLREHTLAGATERRRHGRIGFHDLLVLARNLLRDDARARAELGRRHELLLIDEFQDTDPLQIEIALLLALAGSDASPPDWQHAPVDPGRLFFVGDPKQSIYRFRRADIGVYDGARRRFGGGDLVELRVNHRTVPAVLRWVNAVFEQLIGPGDEGVQPAYGPLDAARGELAGAGVTLLGREDADASAATLREREARDIAAVVAGIPGTWQVGEPSPPRGNGARPARFADVAVLIPTRAVLGELERAFEARGVPYRIESRSLVFGTDEVRELLAVLQAIDDPADAVAVVAALRSPGFACGDDDLARYRLTGGSWNPLTPVSGEVREALGADHPVIAALGVLAELHGDRLWQPVNELVASVVRRLSLVELTTAHDRPRDHWRRIRLVLDEARAFVEAGGESLSDFVAHVEQQSDERASRLESVVPDADDDAVRIVTIHGSKGLEYPIVVLAGLGAEYRPPIDRVLWTREGVEIALGRQDGERFETTGYRQARRDEERFDRAERNRLLYVAATRARDHLVVSLWRRSGRDCSAVDVAAVVEKLGSDPAGPRWHRWVDPVSVGRAPRRPGTPEGRADAPGAPRAPRPLAPAGMSPEDGTSRIEEWERARERLLHDIARRSVTTPTIVAGRLSRQAADDVPYEAGRRGGTAIGRAVHTALQVVDLAEPARDLSTVALHAAAAEGVGDRGDLVEALVASALDAPAVRAAATGRRCWRELFVSAPLGRSGTLVEGYVDLLVETHDGRLVIVDYKTDRAVRRAGVDAAFERYRPQGAAYAAVVAAAVGRPVDRCVFVFCRAGAPPIEREIEDLPAAIEEVTALLDVTGGPGESAR